MLGTYKIAYLVVSRKETSLSRIIAFISAGKDTYSASIEIRQSFKIGHASHSLGGSLLAVSKLTPPPAPAPGPFPVIPALPPLFVPVAPFPPILEFVILGPQLIFSSRAQKLNMWRVAFTPFNLCRKFCKRITYVIKAPQK